MIPATKRRRFGFSLLGLLAATVGTSGCTPPPSTSHTQPISATILREVVPQDGEAKWEVVRITDRKTLDKLESFFPNYRQRPGSSVAGGWMLGYEVYFNFPNGRSVRVLVSENPRPDAWSVGDGDFAVRGDFQAFVDGLK